MKEKFSLLDIDSEPTDEQLHIIMADALKDVIEENRIADLNMKKRIEEYVIRGKDKFNIKELE